MVSPLKSRKKSACFSNTMTSTPTRSDKKPSIIPARPPPAMQQVVCNECDEFKFFSLLKNKLIKQNHCKMQRHLICFQQMVMCELDILLLRSQHFSQFIEKFGYIGILVWFITFDQLAPIPEEISLLVLGYLSAQGIFNPVVAGIFSLIPFLMVDTVYFFLAKKGSTFLKKRLKG